ncbi:MAG: CHAP domain-containing protein [Tetrasphaera sp.]|nr:CHAP domain-containing protein [Tetrasphaera sp.]
MRSRTRLPFGLVARLLLVAVVVTITPSAAGAAPAGWPCYATYSQACISQFGYTGQRPWGYPVDAWGNNCTNYASFRLAQNGAANPGNLGNAIDWDNNAAAKGFRVDQAPAPGSVAQWNTGTYGHVAYVDYVSADGNEIAISESSYHLSDKSPSSSGRRVLTRGATGWPSTFLHIKDVAGTPTADGAFVAYNGHVYRIAGGAPLYVSTWDRFGGGQPTTTLDASQFAALPRYPRDGTFVDGRPSGRVFRFAGGAPHYVSSWNSFGGAQPTIAVDDYVLDNPDGAVPLDHVRRYPEDGTFISNVADGRVYRVAGGAPLYVSTWSRFGGGQPTTALDPWDFANYRNLLPVPRDNTFITGVPSGRVHQVLAGRAFYVSNWNLVGGPKPVVEVDDWAIDNCDHLICEPAGDLNSVSGTQAGGSVRVTGWAIDPNAQSSPVTVHIYVGGPAGSASAEGFNIGTASVARADVGSAYPTAGANHGFDVTLTTSKRGTQAVYAYALNVSGTKGGNQLIGQRTVAIENVMVAPTAPTVMDSCGTSGDTYQISSTTGVEYVVGGVAKAAGTYSTGGALSVAVTARALAGYVLGSSSSWTLEFTNAPCVMTPLASPVRLLDTRPSNAVNAGTARTVRVTGTAGVPAVGVDAVILNVTAVNPTQDGYLAAYPSGTTRPNASSVNYQAGKTIANQVIAKVSTAGTIEVYSSATSNVLVDIAGYYLSGSTYTPMTPTRLLDTRYATGIATTNAVAAGATVSIPVAGIAGIPTSGVAAAVVNITAVNPTQGGYLTAYPGAATRPTASNVNYAARQTIAGMTIAKIGSNGNINLFTSSSSHLIVDIVGWIPSGADYTPTATPTRLLDTRTGLGTTTAGKATGGRTVTVRVTGTAGIPTTGVKAVMVNLTTTGPTSSGWVTAYPGTSRPTASNLNYTTGQTIANSVIAKVHTDGTITLYTSATTHLITDITGYWTS